MKSASTTPALPDAAPDTVLPQTIVLNWQGQVDGTVEAFRVNGMMAIPEPEGVIYVTEAQAAEFFGIDLEANARMSKALQAIIDSHKFNVASMIPADVHALAHGALHPEPAQEMTPGVSL